MKLSFFTRLFSQTIQNRGKIYWQHGRVNITSFDGKTYTATVKGIRDYTTKVTLNGDEIVSSSCDCPYGSNCKHVAAPAMSLSTCMAASGKRSCRMLRTVVE